MIVVDIHTPLKPEGETRFQQLKRTAQKYLFNAPAFVCCLGCTILFALILGLLIKNEIEFSK
jgi:hypothetical protein